MPETLSSLPGETEKPKQRGFRLSFLRAAGVTGILALAGPVQAEKLILPAQERAMGERVITMSCQRSILESFNPESVRVFKGEKGEIITRVEGRTPAGNIGLRELVGQSPKLSQEVAQAKAAKTGFWERVGKRTNQTAESLARALALNLNPEIARRIKSYFTITAGRIFGLVSGKAREPLEIGKKKFERIETVGQLQEAAVAIADDFSKDVLENQPSEIKTQAGAVCVDVVVQSARDGVMEAELKTRP